MWKVVVQVLTIGAVLFLVQCSGTVQKNELHGYEEGVMRAKYITKIFEHKHQDGTPGYKLETTVNYRVGNKFNRDSFKTQYLNQDYSLRHSTKQVVVNGQATKTDIQVKGDRVAIRVDDGKKVDEREATFSGPVFSDVPSVLYTKDLAQPGNKKTYPVLDVKAAQVKDMTIKFNKRLDLTIKGKTYAVGLYQIENLSKPGTFQDYFVDEKSQKIVKIEMGPIKFIPPK